MRHTSELGDALIQSGANEVEQAKVFVTLAQATGVILLVGEHLIDRWNHHASARVGFLLEMDRSGDETALYSS